MIPNRGPPAEYAGVKSQGDLNKDNLLKVRHLVAQNLCYFLFITAESESRRVPKSWNTNIEAFERYFS